MNETPEAWSQPWRTVASEGLYSPSRRKHGIMVLEVAMAAKEKIDWAECLLVEVKPGVQGGAPVFCGTRMPVEVIVDNFAMA